MMKKCLLAALLLAACLLAACAQSEEETTSSPEGSAITGAVTDLEVHDLAPEREVNSVITLGTLELAYQGDNAAAAAINADLRAHLDQYLAETADEDAMLAEADNLLTFTHELIYEPVLLGERYISIIARGYDYQSGAAHPNTYLEGFVYDAASGERLTLAELLGEDYAALLAESVASQIRAAGEENNYYPGYQELLPTLLATAENWYLRDGEICLIFNPDQIAPYAPGVLEFTYPLPE